MLMANGYSCNPVMLMANMAIPSCQGGLYHRLDHLVPGSHGPRHLQLYFYDTEDQALAILPVIPVYFGQI